MTAHFYFIFKSDTFSSTPHNSRSVPHSAQTTDSDYLNLMGLVLCLCVYDLNSEWQKVPNRNAILWPENM